MLTAAVKQRIEDWVTGTVKLIVDNPDEVKVRVEGSDFSATVYLETSVTDVGFVVGKAGSIVSSIRVFLDAIFGKEKAKFTWEYTTDLQVREQREQRRGNGGDIKHERIKPRVYREVQPVARFGDL